MPVCHNIKCIYDKCLSYFPFLDYNNWYLVFFFALCYLLRAGF